MKIFQKTGSVLIPLIVGMTLIAVFSTTILTTTTTTTYNEQAGNALAQARYMAESGRRCVKNNILPPLTKDYSLSNGFGFSVIENQGAVIGIVNKDTIFEARRIVNLNMPMAGNGTDANPWQISTPTQLQNVGSGTSHNDGSGNDYKLSEFYEVAADIVLNPDDNFDPIGESGIDKQFSGSFDGKGHMIKNLTINRPEDDSVGLFASAGLNVNITSINLIDVNINGHDDVGGLIGWFGWNTPNFVSKCSVTGTVSGRRYIGGLIGSVINNENSISDCYSQADVRWNDDDSFTTSASYGGLIGWVWHSPDIKRCYAIGKLTVPPSDPSYTIEKGGLVGKTSSVNALVYSYYDCDIYGSCAVPAPIKGTPLKSVDMNLRTSYSEASPDGWDFVDVWFEPAGAPPVLR
ncbi:hypothetical protein QUF76_10005 [Desulfobacterales bacterium HSG16]|nr:hypothetical protein [Desulfobacterales bacterium HSG16]